jgi:hypothetical protein
MSNPMMSLPLSKIAGFISLVFTAQILFADPLPSWRPGSAKDAIIAYVENVTDPGSSDYIPQADRIATFDNDGTLWSEQPMYFQLFYLFDRVKALSPKHPEWKTQEPFASALAGDYTKALAGGDKAIMELVTATHSGMTAEEFTTEVGTWIQTAQHPQKHMLLKDMVFQPMLELLAYLRAEGFKTYIVSGGGVDFMRVFTEEVYGVPPEQVVGSELKVSYELRDGIPVIVKQPSLDFIDDKTGKPVGIYQHIGRRPVFAAGNSDGDQQMLEYTTLRRSKDDETARLGLLIHHDDAEREWAYDRDSHFGELNRALDLAPENGWLVVSMKDDWSVIYPSVHE